MRSLKLILLLVCIGNISYAQNKTENNKIKAVKMPVKQTLKVSKEDFQTLPVLTSIYKVKHARVKIALSFRTRARKTKLA